MLAEDWGQTMWRASWQAGLLALAVWGVCRMWRRMPAGLCCGLWILVCVKLLVGLLPVAISLPVLPPEPVAAPMVAFEPQPFTAVTTVASLPAPEQPVSIFVYLLAAWALGLVAMLGLLGVAYWKLRRIARQSREMTLSWLAEMAAQLNVGRTPRILVTLEEVGALTLGAFRPIVLLSQSTVETCTEEELKLILAHELAHLRRRDAWWALLPQAATVLFFFHPFVWLAAREYGVAREAACDEIAIDALGSRSDAYGRLLLKLGARRDFASPLFVARMPSHFRTLHRRITMLDRLTNRPHRKTRGALIAGIGALALVLPWSLVNAAAVPAPIEPAKPSQTKPTSTDPIKGKTVTHVVKPVKGKSVVLNTTHAARYVDAYRIGQQIGKEFKASKVLVDPRTNMVHIQAGVSDTVKIRARIDQLDKPGELLNNVQRIPLHYRRSDGVAETLAREFHGQNARLVTDSRSNSLVMAGDPKVIEKMKARVKELDRPPQEPQEPVVMTKTVTLKYVRAFEVSQALMKRWASGKPVIVVDPTTNTLLFRGKPDFVAMLVADAVAQDKGTDPIKKTEPSTGGIASDPIKFDPNKVDPRMADTFKFTLQNANANDVRDLMAKDFVAERVEMVYVYASNDALAIRASGPALKRLGARIAEIDSKAPPKQKIERILRRFPIKNVGAQDLFKKLDLKSFPKIDFVSYDPTDNSIVARGPADELDRFTSYLQNLDVVPPVTL